MTIVVNGQRRDIVPDWTGMKLLEELDLSRERIAVERNGEIMNQETFASCVLSAGDVIEIVRFVGGG
ncbi:MAG: sulfur carrier protein ThiS [Bacilli bacterium]